VKVAEGREITYGIRPENLSIGEHGLTCTVAVVEPTGSETHVVLRIDGREIVAVFRDRVSMRPGDMVTLAPDATQVHLFDKASGTRF
jgi:multiple sugar transport system ATP-binding protein